jgi:hypothetical protein
LALALALALVGCASRAPPPTAPTPISDQVVPAAFDRDGGPWLAQRVGLCGFCGPDGPRQLFVVFADGRLVRIDATTSQNDSTIARGANVTYDAEELRALLAPDAGHGFDVRRVVTAQLDDRREIGVLGALWDPRQPEGRTCADYEEVWRYAPGSPSSFDATCPVGDGDPMSGFAAAMGRIENQTLSVGVPQGV